MSAPAESARHELAREVSRSEEEIDLARAALLVAREEYPQLPVERYRARLDQLAEEVRDRLGQEGAPLLLLQELIDVLYRRHGFSGNSEAYYDPRNSFLNDVLDRRTGIPLTLGIVLLEIGWRLGLPLEGVGFPGHFLVRFAGEEVRLLIDPFDGGRIRFDDEAQELLDRVYGGMVRVRDEFLETATKREMLLRLLGNLKSLYRNVHDDRRALGAVELILLLRPGAPGEIRDRGVFLARLGHAEEASRQLREYLDRAPRAADAPRIRELLSELERGPDADDPAPGAPS